MSASQAHQSSFTLSAVQQPPVHMVAWHNKVESDYLTTAYPVIDQLGDVGTFGHALNVLLHLLVGLQALISFTRPAVRLQGTDDELKSTQSATHRLLEEIRLTFLEITRITMLIKDQSSIRQGLNMLYVVNLHIGGRGGFDAGIIPSTLSAFQLCGFGNTAYSYDPTDPRSADLQRFEDQMWSHADGGRFRIVRSIALCLSLFQASFVNLEICFKLLQREEGRQLPADILRRLAIFRQTECSLRQCLPDADIEQGGRGFSLMGEVEGVGR